MQKAVLVLPAFKLTVVLKDRELPDNLVPVDGPAGEVTLELVLGGGARALRVLVPLSGKNYRKVKKSAAAYGPDNTIIILEGKLKPPTSPLGPLVLEGAGLQAKTKVQPEPQPASTGGPSS